MHNKGYVHGNLKLKGIKFGLGSKVNNVFVNDMMDCVTFNRNGKHIKRDFIKNRIKINQFMSLDRVQGF